MNNLTIVLNSSNYDPIRGVFSYKLQTSEKFHKKKVALVYTSLYKQFDNINSEYNNNIITINWLGVLHKIEIEPGNYTINEINQLIQFYCFENKLYCISDTDASGNGGRAVVFFELLLNPTAYGSQLNFYPIPNSASATTLNYIIPAGANWTFPTTATNPIVSFNSGFGSLIGYTAGTYGTGTNKLSINSNITGQIALVNTLIIRTNLINNSITSPNDVLSAMSTSGEYGSLLIKSPGQLLYSDISHNTFHEIIVYFSSQDMVNLKIRDPSVCIILSIVDL